MAAPAVNIAASSLTVVTLGAAANLLASNKPLQLKSWLPPRGGFVGVINGNGGSSPTAVADPPTPSSSQSSPAAPERSVKPIGGRTGKPAPPCPFGKFPKHKPSKLPGPPKPYIPANNP